MFDADRPIQTSSEDKLNRAQFAKYLARCILDHKEPDSLVVGLHGGWGAGKTSVINMTLEELQNAATNMEEIEKPIILNFSPWSYSGQNELIYSFFRRLSSALRQAPHLQNVDEIIYLLELYVSFFTHKAVPVKLRTKKNLFNKLFSRKMNDIHGWESGQDLTVVKAELNSLLREQQHKIIIIIDNISRLYDQEIKQIFQIVKSMGDYANTVYLLAFDKDQVIRAIDKLDSGTGQDFIEKVIQLPFNIPPILNQEVEQILAYQLEEIVRLAPSDSWDKDYWADIYYSSLKYFFDNCRDITRYANILNFSYERLRDVVNPVDFFALTAIEVFAPEVYIGIRDNKDLFTDLLDNVYVFDKDQGKKDKLRVDEILSRNHHLSKEILLPLFLIIFPRLRHIYQPKLIFFHSENLARKKYRLCSPDLFDAYFRLSMQSSHIEASEFDTLLSLAKDAVSFDHALARLNQDNRIEQFLGMLDSQVLQSLPVENIPSIIAALLDNGDLFPPGADNMISLPTSMRIHRIIHCLLQRLQNNDERYAILKNAISNASKSIYIIVHELRQQSGQHNEKADSYLPSHFRDLTSEHLAELKKLVVARIQYWAKDERLSDHPQLLSILYAWRDWNNDDNVRQFVQLMTNNDRGFITFLMQALARPITEVSTEYKLNPAWQRDLENINAFIAAKTLIPHAKLLFADDYFEKLREKEQLALLIFLDLMQENTEKTIP